MSFYTYDGFAIEMQIFQQRSLAASVFCVFLDVEIRSDEFVGCIECCITFASFRQEFEVIGKILVWCGTDYGCNATGFAVECVVWNYSVH